MLSFKFDGSLTEIEAFVEGLKVFTPGASLGCVESLVEVPSLMIPDEVSRGSATADIPENLVRPSVGIEDVDDLCEDLRSARRRPEFPFPIERVQIIRAVRLCRRDELFHFRECPLGVLLD